MKQFLRMGAVTCALLWLLSCLGGCAPAAEESPHGSDGIAAGETANPPEAVILSDPPTLTVTCGTVSIEALRGTASWMYQTEGGTWAGMEADSMHPLQAKEYMTPLTLPSSGPLTAYLTWDVLPDRVTVRCWSEKYWGQYDASAKAVSAELAETPPGYAISLKDGAYIYEVTAHWDSRETWQGSVHYSFYTQPSEG